jgi:DNA repair exonuclease SbcCD ATPase subunit
MESFEDRFSKVVQRYQALKAQTESAKENYEASVRQVNQTDLALKIKQNQYDLQQRGITTMRLIAAKLSEQGIETLKDLLSNGLQTIFNDRQYSVHIEISDRGNNKTAEFYLRETRPDGTVTTALLKDSVGGGIQTMISLLLRIYFIVMTGGRRFLVFDEALSQLSDQYVDPLFKFLRSVVDDLGFDILFVTHDPRFTPYADKVFRVKDGAYKQLTNQPTTKVSNG